MKFSKKFVYIKKCYFQTPSSSTNNPAREFVEYQYRKFQCRYCESEFEYLTHMKQHLASVSFCLLFFV